MGGLLICSKCGVKKNNSEFHKDKSKKTGYYSFCKSCKSKYYFANRKKKAIKSKIYRAKNKEKIAAKNREWVENNKEKVREYQKNYERELRKNIEYQLHSNISRAVRAALFAQAGNKNGKSIFEYLPYSADTLKKHLENKFEDWMNWDNYGIYKVEEWDDNDSSTWKWQIDHIIPQCNFKYSSMEEDDFLKCWALKNLRPYSSKGNLQKSNIIQIMELR